MQRVQHPGDIDIHHGFPLLKLALGQRVKIANPCVGDDHVDATPMFRHPGGTGSARFGQGHITRHNLYVTSQFTTIICKCVQGLSSSRGGQHAMTGLCQGDGRRPANARRSSGDPNALRSWLRRFVHAANLRPSKDGNTMMYVKRRPWQSEPNWRDVVVSYIKK